jgi:hypothetical protein
MQKGWRVPCLMVNVGDRAAEPARPAFAGKVVTWMSGRRIALLLAIAGAVLATHLVQLLAPGAATRWPLDASWQTRAHAADLDPERETSRGAGDRGTFTRSFGQGGITLKVSGSVGGIQTGPFHNVTVTEEDRGKHLVVGIIDVTSAGGARLPSVPIHLYRSYAGEVSTGDLMIAFSAPPVRNSEEVAAQTGARALAVQAPPGQYFVFFPYTRPVVRIPDDAVPATITYWITVE